MANPIAGWTRTRDDQGVDAGSPAGTPYICPASCRRVGPPITGWLPFLYLFEFDPPLRGTYQNCQLFYVAEGVTVPNAPTYKTGQVMCRSTGSGIETGWGATAAESGGAMTLAGKNGQAYQAAHPAAGASTVWGQTFAAYFGIQPIGSSGKGGAGHATPGGSGGITRPALDTSSRIPNLLAAYEAQRDLPRDQGTLAKFVSAFVQLPSQRSVQD